jgi:hypothetical protein
MVCTLDLSNIFAAACQTWPGNETSMACVTKAKAFDPFQDTSGMYRLRNILLRGCEKMKNF